MSGRPRFGIGAEARQYPCPLGDGHKLDVEIVTHARRYSRAQKIEQTEKQEQRGHQAKQRSEGGKRSTCQHPIIDLQHEHWSGQHQDIDRPAEQTDCQESPANATKDLA